VPASPSARADPDAHVGEIPPPITLRCRSILQEIPSTETSRAGSPPEPFLRRRKPPWNVRCRQRCAAAQRALPGQRPPKVFGLPRRRFGQMSEPTRPSDGIEPSTLLSVGCFACSLSYSFLHFRVS